MLSRPPLGPYPSRVLSAATIFAALTVALIANGHAQAALATGTIATAATLSVLRQLINRENL